MILGILKLFCVLAAIAFLLNSDKAYLKTRNGKLVRISVWILLAILNLLIILFKAVSLWPLTIIELALDIHIIYQFAKELWPDAK